MTNDEFMDRYHRQILLPQIGTEGQKRLGSACIAILGCGALGTVAAELLVRAGVGFVRLIDRDLVELTNLQRQTLYDEADVRDATPKAVAAANRLRAINSSITIEPVVADVHSGNLVSLIRDVDLVVDGLDNADTRYLLNDACVSLAKPWVYGAAVGIEGRAMPIIPGDGPCLRCLWPDPPAAGELPTCDTVGVLGTVTSLVGAAEATIAQELITDRPQPHLLRCSVMPFEFRLTRLDGARRSDCPCCGLRRFEFLDRPVESSLATLCGQDAVQIRPTGVADLDLAALATRLAVAGVVQRTPFLVRCDLAEAPGVRLTVFRDGRAILNGVRDLSRARSLYARFVGL
jgi:adenylyltransferase/sulfurtransferase